MSARAHALVEQVGDYLMHALHSVGYDDALPVLELFDYTFPWRGPGSRHMASIGTARHGTARHGTALGVRAA